MSWGVLDASWERLGPYEAVLEPSWLPGDLQEAPLLRPRPPSPGKEEANAPAWETLVIRTAPRARERARAQKVGKSYHKILSLNLM